MIPCAGTMRDRARAHCTISVFNAHIVIKGPRYQMRGGPPVIRASDRPIIPSALLTKNIMPISGDLFRACAEPCSLCPCPTPYFLFSSYLDSPPSSLSLSFHLGETYHVRSLPPSSRLVLPLCYPLPFADLYSRCVAQGATGTRVLPFQRNHTFDANLRRSFFALSRSFDPGL